jgi:predicted nucleic acid-binding protein
MSAPAFFDSNVIIYTDDHAVPEKQRRAVSLFAEHQVRGTATLSLQVLQEYFSAATRKLRVDAELAQRKVQVLARCHVVRFAEDDVIAAIELHRLTRISFWDALIVHAARVARAAVLFSEDLADDAVIAGVRVVNPFRT